MEIQSQSVYLKNLSEVMEEYKPAYRDDWDATMKFFLSDKNDTEIINELTKELLKHGVFREPIVIIKDEEGNKSVADGNHRVITAFINNVEKVIVAEGYPIVAERSYMYSTVDLMHEIDEDDFFEIMESLTSFPLNEEIWLNCDISSGQTGKSWTFYWTETNMELISKVNEKVCKRLDEKFPHMNFTVNTEISEFSDEVWDE